MISDQNVGWVETSNETTDDKVQKVSSDEVEWGIVDADHYNVILNIACFTQFLLLTADSNESYLHLRYKKG